MIVDKKLPEHPAGFSVWKWLRGRRAAAKKAALALAALPVLWATSAGAAGFSYSYANPYDAAASTYIESTSNIALYSEGTVRLWKPTTGGTTLANTTPGVITYKFDFGTEVVETANLTTNNPTFHWSYSRGYNRFYGSKDGIVWEQLLDVTTPAFSTANSGYFNGLLPATLLGGNQLWFKAELYSFGRSAPSGGVLTNTAQHSRWDINSGPNAKTFALDVTFKDTTTIPGVPLPSGLPLMGAGIVLLGVMRRRKAPRTT